MKLRSIALAAALAASTVPAFAVSGNLGPLALNVAEGFGNFFTSQASVFADTFTFSLASAQTVNGLTGFTGFTNIGVTVTDAMGNQVGADNTPGMFSFALCAGNYTLNVVGFGASAGAFYGGNVTAVPEPETYALMLAGLGIIGFIGARRRERS